MKKIISHILFIIVTISQAQVNVQWVQNTAGVSITVDSNNNVYTVYYEYNPAGDIYLTKRNSDGVFIWQERFDQTDNSKWEKATWLDLPRLWPAPLREPLRPEAPDGADGAVCEVHGGPAGAADAAPVGARGGGAAMRCVACNGPSDEGYLCQSAKCEAAELE